MCVELRYRKSGVTEFTCACRAMWPLKLQFEPEIVLRECKIEKMCGQKAWFLLARVVYSEYKCGFKFFSLKYRYNELILDVKSLS